MLNYKSMQSVLYVHRELAVYSIKHPEFKFFWNCDDKFIKTVCSADMVYFIDEENIGIYVFFLVLVSTSTLNMSNGDGENILQIL